MRVEIACSSFSRLRGLIGRGDYPGVLLLAPCNDVHTFGMSRAVDIAFIASDGTVLESHRNVGAHRRMRCKCATATLERFAAESPWFERGEQIELKNLVRENLSLRQERGSI